MNLFADPLPPPPVLPTYNEAVGKILAHLKLAGTKGASAKDAAQATGIHVVLTYAILHDLRTKGLAIFGLPEVIGEHGMRQPTETFYFNHTRKS